MGNKFLLDSSAWVEYFAGTSYGVKVGEILEKDIIITSILTIAELSDKFAREKKTFEPSLKFILYKSGIVGISLGVAKNSGQLKSENRKQHKKFSLADSILYLTSQEQGAELITLDQDFEGLKGVIVLE